MNDFLRMLALVCATFALMKIIVARMSGAALAPRQWLAFAAWPGMRPARCCSRSHAKCAACH